MSELTQENFKKQVVKRPATPNDAVYLLSGRYVCPHCKNSGRKKIHHTLWSLIHHVSYHHSQKGDFC